VVQEGDLTEGPPGVSVVVSRDAIKAALCTGYSLLPRRANLMKAISLVAQLLVEEEGGERAGSQRDPPDPPHEGSDVGLFF
jgi:hypothetical protein